MFSLKTIGRIRSCLQKERLWIFITLFLVVNTAFACRKLRDVTHFSRDLSFKSQAIRFIKKDGAKAEWCFLGSSLTFTGIDPNEFNYRSINLAGESYNLDICMELFDLYKKDLSNLKIVVAEASLVTLYKDTIVSRSNKNQLEIFFDWGLTSQKLMAPLRTSKIRMSEVLMPVMRDPVHALLFPTSNSKRLSNKYPYFLHTRPGYVALKIRTEKDIFPVINEGELLKDPYRKTKEEWCNRQISSLRKIKNSCQKSGVQFAIVLPPIHSSARDTEDYAQYRKAMSGLLTTEDIDELHVYDCSHLIPDEHFRDLYHIDSVGSKKYSKSVHRFFSRICD